MWMVTVLALPNALQCLGVDFSMINYQTCHCPIHDSSCEIYGVDVSIYDVETCTIDFIMLCQLTYGSHFTCD